MKYCSNCGNQLADESVICPRCGCATGNNPYAYTQYNKAASLSVLSIVGFVFAFISPLVGLICSIIAYRSAIEEGNERSKNFSKTGIIISAVFIGIGVVIGLIVSMVIIASVLSIGTILT